MTEMDDFVGRVRGLVISLQGILTPEECSEVDHLIDHGEPAEGLVTLAWIIVDEKKRVPIEAIEAIRDLSAGLVSPEEMPPELDKYGIGPEDSQA